VEQDESYRKQSAKNEGKYDVDIKTGLIIDKATGKVPVYIFGNPFPTIDPKDPKVAEKIMENFQYSRARLGSQDATAESKFVGKGGLENRFISAGDYFFYQNRVRGEIPNPSSFLSMTMTGVEEPFSFRGIRSMIWTYNDTRDDAAFSYIPMLRRVRRMSASTNRSDPYMGGDGCIDDAWGYNGKNADMKFKLLV